MAISNGPVITKSGLILYLDAANRKSYISGSTSWNDLSARNITGSILNGTTFNSIYGGGLQFDGINDYSRVSNLSGLNDIRGPGTIMYWGTFPGFGNSLTLRVTGQNQTLQIGARPEFGLGTIWRWGGTSLLNYTLPTFGQVTNWCLTFNSSSLQMYVNGVLDAQTNTAVPNTGSVGDLYVATFDTVPNAPWSGSIYSIILYDRVLSSTEILQNFNATRARFGV